MAKKRTKKSKPLVIVESPTKAKTISRFLGSKYIVTSSMGHIRDLPKSTLGVDPENNFEPKYLIPRKKSQVVKDLRAEAKNASRIILATDEDREGEAIAWHLVYALKLDEEKSKLKYPEDVDRIVFHEITNTAIEEALKNPRPLDEHLVDAQQTRRILDRIVGYKLSPFLWKKIMRGLSAGRVQSVALRMIIERERERQEFKKEEYWTITGTFKTIEKKKYTGELHTLGGKPLEKFDITDKTRAGKVVANLEKADWKIVRVDTRTVERSPLAPFTTSTLQQEASRRMKYSAKQTMMVAQQLYEGIDVGEGQTGLITYMRTDSVNVSQEALGALRSFVEKEHGKEFVPATPHIYKTKSKNAQEAHEAIRPTDVTKTPESIKEFLDAKQFKLYNLIWRRFVASQMTRAVFDATTIDTGTNEAIFRSTGQIIRFPGFLEVWNYTQKKDTPILPEVKEQESVTLAEIEPIQHFTEPPARYSDATLVKSLEGHDIGRPSTYAPTISTILDRGYVVRDGDKRFAPSEMGFTVNDMLVEHFPEIVNYAFTARMEQSLDSIAEGKLEWRPLISEFYHPLEKHLEEKYETVEKIDMTEETDEACEKCGKPMIVRFGRFGKFVACSGFPDCHNTKALPPKSIGISCPECNKGEIVERKTKKRRVFYGCSLYPDCEYATWNKPKEAVEETKTE